MPEKNVGKENEDLTEFLRMVHRASSDSDMRWETLPPPAELSRESLDRTLELARLARSIAREELTLGKYLTDLRIRNSLSRSTVAKQVKLSPDTIGELEADSVPIQSVPAARLATLAVMLNAFKSATLELLQRRMVSTGPQALPRLTRMGIEATYLEAERARRHTQAGGARLPIDKYLSDFANAFDEEKKKIHQP